jgi:hypothetical protein
MRRARHALQVLFSLINDTCSAFPKFLAFAQDKVQ